MFLVVFLRYIWTGLLACCQSKAENIRKDVITVEAERGLTRWLLHSDRENAWHKSAFGQTLHYDVVTPAQNAVLHDQREINPLQLLSDHLSPSKRVKTIQVHSYDNEKPPSIFSLKSNQRAMILTLMSNNHIRVGNNCRRQDLDLEPRSLLVLEGPRVYICLKPTFILAPRMDVVFLFD